MASLPRLHCLRILPILASLLLWCPVLPAAGEEARPYDPLRTMAALNQAAMSVSAIVNFDDRAVLDQEYRNIINNLSFGEVEADQELVDLYLALMDTLSKGTLREDERNSISQSYSRNSKKAMSSALSSVALSPDPASLFLGGILSVGSVFFDSKEQVDKYRLEFGAEESRLEKSRREDLNELQKKLFQASWKLMRKYGLPDAARLTQENAESFWDAVKDRDLPRRLRRLQRMEKQMEFFPPFWYYRARSALDTDDRPSALSFFRKYREKRKPVIRTDPYLAASSMNILALAGGDLEREEKLSLLDEVVSNSRNEDWANFIYAGLQFMLLGEREKGAECLQRNVDNGQEPSLSGLLLSNMGRDSLLEGVPKLLSKEIETLTAQVAGKGFLKNQDLLEIYAKDGDPGILASIPSQLQGIDFQTASRAGRKDVLALVIPERWLSGALTAGNGKGNAPSAARVHFSISVLLSGQEACSVTEKNFRPQGEKAKGREPVLSYDSARKSFVLFAEGTFSPGRRGEVRISHDASIPVGLFFEGETESFRTSPKNARDAADKVLTYGIPLFGQIRLLRDALHDTGMLLTQGTKYRPLGLAFQGKSLAWNGDKLIEGEIPGMKGEKRP